MAMVYLIFIMTMFLIRIFAGYDSRYQKGKYFVIKNAVLSKILMDTMSFDKSRRLKKDRNKISLCGVCFYAAAATVLLINVIFLLTPKIPAAPWVYETSRFFVATDTLNHKISAIAILLLLSSTIVWMTFWVLRSSKESKVKWVEILAWVVGVIMILCAGTVSIALLVELISTLK